MKNPLRAILPALRGALATSTAASTGRPSTNSAYLRDNTSSFLFGWRPALREPVDENQMAWISAASKTIDAIHNSGWLSGGVDQAVAQMVGNGLNINLKPKLGILGDQEKTEAWAREVEAKWNAYTEDPLSCDLGGRQTLGQIAAQGVRQMFATGEMIGTLPYRERPGSSHGLKVNLMPSSRLSQGNGPGGRGTQGVTMDGDGLPVAYTFLVRPPNNIGGVGEATVAARDSEGRPAVFHFFDAGPTAVRGITPLAPVLRVIRQVDQLADATLTAALIQAIFAATIESPAPTADIMKALQNEEEAEATAETGTTKPGDFATLMNKRLDWYRNTKFDLGNFGKMVHLFPGEQLDFKRSEHPNSTYEVFMKMLLRECARCLGITYEQFTGDYVGATYSSLRMGTADMWLINLARRARFPARLYQTVFEAWLEEEIAKGLTEFPGGVEAYLAQRREVAVCDWRGPPKPTADDLKTAKAQQIQRAEGWVPTEQLAAEYGNDHRDVIESQARTHALREKNKLDPLPSLSGGGTPADGGAGGQAGDPAGTGGAAGKSKAEIDAMVDRDSRLVTALINDDDASVQAILVEFRDAA
jgi:lambda family phage portal protein